MNTRNVRLALFCLPLMLFPLAPGLDAQPAPAAADLLRGLQWRNIGPANMSGRISDIEALDGDFAKVLVATASGGVFKSVNAGTTWQPIFDKYGSASIGDVAWFQKNSDIIWVGTGEECIRNSVAWGDGIYKSTDGGKTFVNMGLKDTHSIGRVLAHPTDPNIVYVAAAGHSWGYTGDRGLFKTIDGGRTWQKLAGGLPSDGRSGAIDMVMDSRDPSVLYVAFWQRLRQPWRFDSGGPSGGIFKSVDAGKTWRKLTAGLPAGDTGRIGLTISRSKPDVLMAIVEHTFQPQQTIRDDKGQTKENPDYKDMTKLGSGIYRSEDGGKTWKFLSRQDSRPFYYSHLELNPVDDQRVYYLTANFMKSEDGGKTWQNVPGLHPDYHAMWLDPTNKDRYYTGQDAGAALTHDHGKTYIYFDNICAGQFYAVSADMRDPYYVYGGLQDNGVWGGPSMHREGVILTDFWYNIGGGDGFHTQNDPTDWRTVYGESQGGAIQRTNVETRESRGVVPNPQNIVNYRDYYPSAPTPTAGGRPRSVFRFNWSTPIYMSPHNPRTLYLGANHLFRSVDRGDHWQIVSPDLTTNDKQKFGEQYGGAMKPSGGMTTDDTGAETHCTIITISESPVRPGVLWVGTDDGNVQVTKDGGTAWTNVRANVQGVPNATWVSRVEASHFAEGTAYLTFDGHRGDDFKPYVFVTTDFGKTWTAITSGIPDNQPVYVIREDLRNKDLLFLGTEFGVFFSLDAGKQWNSLRLNMPTVAFHDLLIHPRDNDLIAGTHGRGIWILDDISALQQATPDVLAGDAKLFTASRPATRWLRVQRGGYGRGDLYFKGENPQSGGVINYFLKAAPQGPATVEITDGDQLKTTYVLDDGRPGVNRIAWDMRWDPSASLTQSTASNAKSQIEQALGRTGLTADQKAVLEENLALVAKYTTNYRKLTEIMREIADLVRPAGTGIFAGGGGGTGRMGGLAGLQAGPGTYVVKLTVNGKTTTGKITVRLDPIQAGQ
jgi:photosystem II stability/assembly factor-like uncharacterized protein